MEKLLFIYNPHAGKGQVRNKVGDIINAFTRSGCLCTAYPTQGPGDAAHAAKELSAGYDRLAVCGGDGTLHEVVTGLMELPESARPPIGYLPAGTTNDYARNLNLPKSFEDMATLAATGEPRAVDIGRLGSHYFIYVAAFGAFTDVAYNTPQQFKNALGHLAYVLKGATELASLKSYHLRVEHDGGVVEGDYIYGMVSNTVSVGGVLGLPPEEVALDDGLLEAVLIETPKTMAQLNATILALAKQEFSTDSGVVGLHSARFHVACQERVPLTLDGEYGGSHKEGDILAVPGPVKIVYGKESHEK